MIVNKYKNGGGGSGSGTTYTAGEYISLANDVISVTGITPSEYLTTADTQDLASKAYVTGITNPIQTQVDDIERVTATALTELHDAILELSGDTPDMSNYYTKAQVDAEITGATQGFLTSADTQDFLTTADTQDLMNSTDAEVISTALNDLDSRIDTLSGSTSGYATHAEVTAATANLASQTYVNNQITAATQGMATQAYVTGITSPMQTAINGKVGSDGSVDNIVKISQAGYDALVAGGTVDTYTFYIITGSTGN